MLRKSYIVVSRNQNTPGLPFAFYCPFARLGKFLGGKRARFFFLDITKISVIICNFAQGSLQTERLAISLECVRNT